MIFLSMLTILSGCAINGADHGGRPAAYGAPRSVTDPEASPLR